MGTLVSAACSPTAGGPTTSATSATSTPSPPSAGTVTLSQSAFAQTSVTISAGHSLRFDDPDATGGNHKLCLGMDGHCDANAEGPDELHSPGLTLTPGTTADINFPRAGQYQVTCAIHPNMNLTITVLGTG
jgi:plastocyanin